MGRSAYSSESSSLLNESKQGYNQLWMPWSRRYRTNDACVSSKSARLTLFWCFCAGILYRLASSPSKWILQTLGLKWAPLLYIVNGVILCLYPLSGYLADNVIERFKTIIRSLQLLVMAVIVAILPISIFTVLFLVDTNATAIMIGKVGLVSTCILFYLIMNVSLLGFNANVIQFGMEQLYDSPAHHQSLFIYWFVWIYYVVQLLIAQPWHMISTGLDYFKYAGSSLFFVLALPCFVMVIVSLCVAHRNKNWFLINPARINPYKLVKKITHFARQHKVPIHRSAFTYCEDEIPTGLDLAKTKYGGPFTTDEVENVKAFYGILKILLCLGPVFCITFTAEYGLNFYIHVLLPSDLDNRETSTLFYRYVLDDDTISLITSIILIPSYLTISKLLRCRYSLNMLKRIGLGILLLILTLVSIVASLSSVNTDKHFCISNQFQHNGDKTLIYIQHILRILPRFLYGISKLFLYTALYQFICAQSPPSMKGLLIGLCFAIKGAFQVIAAVFAIPFFSFIFPGCHLWYYGINITLAVLTFITYSYFARKYQYRQRDEICNVYQYAEEYYSNN